MRNLFPILVTLLFVSCAGQNAGTVVIQPCEGDCTPLVRRIIASHPEGNLTMEFQPGRYDFYPEEASEEYLSISNNDNGLKRIIFNFHGMKNVCVKGGGAEFVFHGAEIPFAVTQCSGVSFEDFSIDYEDHFTLEGEVVANDRTARSFTLRLLPDEKYKIVDGEFRFCGYNWDSALGENIVFDKNTRSPYYFTAAYEHWTEHRFNAEEVAPGVVRFSNLYSREVPPVGSIWVDKGRHSLNRYCPAFALTDSKDLSLKNIHVYHSGAMALIAQCCENIALDGYSTAQHTDSPRMITASADATHFVDCKGTIIMENCDFESMLDDATNIHQTYMLVQKVLSGNRLAASFGHFQQEGNRFADSGDTLRFVDKTSLRPIGTARLVSINRVNENWYEMEVASDLPEMPDPKQYAVENISRGTSEVVIRDCSVKHNRARSLLLSTPGNVLVENCEFASMMAGIRICGDANYWFEAGQTQNIVIRGNHFQDLGIGGHSPQAVLQIDPIIPKDARSNDYYYHENIVFENNTVDIFDSQIIYAIGVADLSIKGNVFRDSHNFEPIFPNLSAIDLQYCGKVDISGNDFSSWKKDATVSIHSCSGMSIDTTLPVVDNPNPYFFEN